MASGNEGVFLGYAKLSFNTLNFEHDKFTSKHRKADEKKVLRLLGIFKLQGCDREDEEHCIVALVDPAELDEGSLLSLRQSISLRDAKTLRLPSALCLNGIHRVRAAERFLDRNDRWWPCRLFHHRSSAIRCHWCTFPC